MQTEELVETLFNLGYGDLAFGIIAQHESKGMWEWDYVADETVHIYLDLMYGLYEDYFISVFTLDSTSLRDMVLNSANDLVQSRRTRYKEEYLP